MLAKLRVLFTPRLDASSPETKPKNIAQTTFQAVSMVQCGGAGKHRHGAVHNRHISYLQLASFRFLSPAKAWRGARLSERGSAELLYWPVFRLDNFLPFVFGCMV